MPWGACLGTHAGLAGGRIWTSASQPVQEVIRTLKLLQTRVRLQGYESVENRFKLN